MLYKLNIWFEMLHIFDTMHVFSPWFSYYFELSQKVIPVGSESFTIVFSSTTITFQIHVFVLQQCLLLRDWSWDSKIPINIEDGRFQVHFTISWISLFIYKKYILIVSVFKITCLVSRALIKISDNDHMWFEFLFCKGQYLLAQELYLQSSAFFSVAFLGGQCCLLFLWKTDLFCVE